MSRVNRTLTISTDQALQDALSRRAQVERKSMSDVAREILESVLGDRPLTASFGKVRSDILFGASADAWQRAIRKRNWRP